MTDSTAQAAQQQPDVTIPLIDIRQGGPIDLVHQRKDQLNTIIRGIKRQFGILSRVLLPPLYTVLDFLSRRWLKKTDNPYRGEIEKIAKAVGQKGLVAQNMAYEWSCCTTGVMKTPQTATPQLVRVMDWIIPDMGKNIIVAHQSGKAGDFYNITWPGLSGVLNGVAKGRFAAAINQAPMRRHLMGNIVTDWIKNHVRMFKSKGLPPPHLLRKAFENAATYDEAKKMLMTEPVCMPVMFTLSGVNPGEGCVIERLEDKAIVREMKDDRAFVTNHFQSNLNGIGEGWMPRGFDNHARAEAALKISPDDVGVGKGFDWFKAPIANKFSVLAMVADAKTGEFHLTGTDAEKIVTKDFRLPPDAEPQPVAAAKNPPPAPPAP
ncbi:MAG: hypothetical protein EPN97_13815 [Alphaproteobacteria bacterium]|nr:MAG: hypothetical protein EPN97_13815 [Alphaproteobacteria bacterium]